MKKIEKNRKNNKIDFYKKFFLYIKNVVYNR